MLDGHANLVGIGLYDRQEASRLSAVKPDAVTRWLVGYRRKGVDYEPLWRPRSSADGELLLDFRDLMELRQVKAFAAPSIDRRNGPQRRGVGLQTMRRWIALAQERIGDPHPLSTLRFKSDGVRIFFEVLEAAEGEPALEDLFSGQRQMIEIIERTLHDIDFENDYPRRWWPMRRAGGIVVDPSRCFGQPIDDETSIPTATLALAATTEGGVAAAARLYAVPENSVRRAIRFEHFVADA